MVVRSRRYGTEEVRRVAHTRRYGTEEARKVARTRRCGTGEVQTGPRNALAKEEDQEGLRNHATAEVQAAVRTRRHREMEEGQMAPRTPTALEEDC